MPQPGARTAPETFEGDPEKLDDFLDRFEGLATQARLTNDDKFKSIVQYCSRKMKLLFQSLVGYQTRVWVTFLQSVRAVFPTRSMARLYSRQTLIALVSRTQKQRIATEEDLMEYYRNFVTVANWLRTNNKISDMDMNAYFWFGFHSQNRRELEQQLRILLPLHNREDPWPMNDVFNAAKYVFNSLAFDQDPSFIQYAIQQPVAAYDSEPEEDLPEVAELKRERLRRAAATETMRLRAEPLPAIQQQPEVQQTVTRTVQFPQRPVQNHRPQRYVDPDAEIDDLVGKLASMNFNEPQYAIAYARLSHKYPGLLNQFVPPRHQSAPNVRGASFATVPVVPAVAVAAVQPPYTPGARVPYGYNNFPANRTCHFCRAPYPECRGIKNCAVVAQYIAEGKIRQENGYICFPNGDKIFNHEQGLKFVVDQHSARATNSSNYTNAYLVALEPIDTSHSYAHLEDFTPEETAEAGEAASMAFTRSQSKGKGKEVDPNSDSQPRTQETTPPRSVSIMPRPGPPFQRSQTIPAPTQTQSQNVPDRRPPQFQFRSKVEDEHTADIVFNKLLDNAVKIDSRELLAVSPDIRRRMVDLVRTSKMIPERPSPNPLNSEPDRVAYSATVGSFSDTVKYSSPIREIACELPYGIEIRGVIDSGSEIVVMREAILKQVGHPVNARIRSNMTSSNNTGSTLCGVAEMLPIKIGSIITWVHAHITKDAPFDLLLGQSWINHANAIAEPQKDGGTVLHIRDPANHEHWLEVPTFEHKARPAPKSNYVNKPASQFAGETHSAHMTTLDNLSMQEEFISEYSPLFRSFHSSEIPHWTISALLYKKVANKKRPVPSTFPEHAKALRRFPEDPLLSLPSLAPFPPTFTPGTRLTQKRWDEIEQKLIKNNFLWPEEIKLAAQVLMNNEFGLAWDESERGRFRDDYFAPVVMPTIEHTPWMEKPLPIPPGCYDEIVGIIKDKIANGAYEPSTSSYSSRWFCVFKKNGKLRIVHDLQTLNSVTIRMTGNPPVIHQYVERYAGRAIYSILDVFVGYDNRVLAKESRHLTAFQTPFGMQQLTTVPLGWTNSFQEWQEDMYFILAPEIEVVEPYADDAPIRGGTSRHELPNGTYELHPLNPLIRRFVWEHLLDVNRILHRFKHSGATISAVKLDLCVPKAEITGHLCSYDGVQPTNTAVSKIQNWPTPTNVTQTKGFLGLVGTVRKYIKNCSKISYPLNAITKKSADFIWNEECQRSFEELKTIISSKPLVRPIDYKSLNEVTLAVDSSSIAVGFILSQQDNQDRRWPAFYGSITMSDTESRYSQAKLELYGLFRALKATKYYIIGLRNFVVELDASYVRGMLNNPDIQPNASINRWIAGILLFDFTIRHVKAEEHKGPDALSRRPFAEGDVEEKEDIEEWLDDALSLGAWISTWLCNNPGDWSTPFRTPLYDADYYRDDFHEATISNAFKASIDQYFVQVYSSNAHDELEQDPIVPETIPAPPTDAFEPQDLQLELILEYLRSGQLPRLKNKFFFNKVVPKIRNFFFRAGVLWRRQPTGYHQKVILDKNERLDLLNAVHDKLGHKRFYSTRRLLLDRFWWPSLERDLKSYLKTCHECQLRNMTKIHIPPVINRPAPLFTKAYIDTMFMPTSHGMIGMVHAADSLMGWPEAKQLRRETARTLAQFIFEDLICRWGSLMEIVTDNGPPFLAALEILSQQYNINHIRISAYNSQANGIIERPHLTLREAIVKSCEGDIKRWPIVAPHAVWATRVSIKKSTGYSPFYMAHGVEPILPFDIVHATYLVPKFDAPLTTPELIAIRARQLERRESDLAEIERRVIQSRYASLRQFIKENQNRIREQDFAPGTLVLVRNKRAEQMGGKTLPRYYGPMVVIARRGQGSYTLAELDGAVSKSRYAAFRLLEYYPRDPTSIKITSIIDDATLNSIAADVEQDAQEDD